MATDKERVNAAFKELRQLGYIARQNFKCCSSCAWAEIPEEADKIVFYNQQSNATAWTKSGRFGKGSYKTPILQGPLFLQWSGDAQEITTVLRRHSLNVEWKGTDSDGIGIMPSEISEAAQPII